MINYVIGDATNPQGNGNKIIAHVVNDLGLWGSGFVVPLGNKWPRAKHEYQQWAHGNAQSFALGETQLVQVEDDIYIANMVAQRGVRGPDYTHPLRYDALGACLWILDTLAIGLNASIHMPRIGCGLAGGVWEEVEPLILEELRDRDVTVYDLE